ncbi:protein of unknown function [endosymbiont DhMRE of Dentiscutata heterogama]|uniref:hypothetical protein n=1 Tax=endosymbiont DhMRE of Dentiscutata heterogama TaxID=1609546 RepID=UPI000629D628|nr:hypothetical protein [endosymbiont DhMRE of Dentiscutata heterogama]CFW93202.1 protein of unknown function [endosymbiont DhMRE of Dentiscutata heterogama]
MVKYFLNIRQSGKSDDMEGNITYDFDLENSLRFPFSLDGKNYAYLGYKHLEIKTSKNRNEIFRGDVADIDRWGVIETYWNLCVPDDNEGFPLLGSNDKLTLYDTDGNIYLEPLHFSHLTLKIKPVEITWKSNENIRLKLASSYSVQDEIQNFNININEIDLRGKNIDKSHSLIANCIEKGQDLTLKFRSPNSAYFRKNYSNNQLINTLVIPENSLQEDLATQNQNPNSSSLLINILLFSFLGIIILISFFLLFLIKRKKSRKK